MEAMTEEQQRQSKAYAEVKARLWGQPAITNLIADQHAIEREKEQRRRREADRIAEIEARLEAARNARKRALEMKRLRESLTGFSTKAEISKTFDDEVQILAPKPDENSRPSMEAIANAVMDKYPGVTLDEIRSPARSSKIVMARREIIVRIRQIRPDISFPRIGAFLCKDHSSCVHAFQQWEKQHQ
jgi:chromosomal replication initiation ATPase DnaA